MRAVRVHSWGEPPVVEDVERPERGEAETLVRVEAAALAHLDRTVATGEFGIKPTLPYTPGVEGCGVVVESDTLEPGQRVMLRGGGLGLTRDGTWAEYVVARTKHLTVLPSEMPPALGATFFVPLTTAAVALRETGRLGDWPGLGDAAAETVVVAGAAGAVGSMVAQLARDAGSRVIGVVTNAAQVGLLPEGIEPVVIGDQAQAVQYAKDRPATLLVDTLGGQGLLERASWVTAGGRAVAIGYVTGNEAVIDLPNWLLQDVALLPVNMIRRDAQARALAAELVPQMVSGELRLAVETLPFEEAPSGLARLAAGDLRGRGVLVPEGAQDD